MPGVLVLLNVRASASQRDITVFFYNKSWGATPDQWVITTDINYLSWHGEIIVNFGGYETSYSFICITYMD